MMASLNPVEFYEDAKNQVILNGYQKEIDVVNNRKFEDIDAEYFLNEFIFVVLSAGKSNKAVITTTKKIRENNFDLFVIGHSKKILAIIEGVNNHEEWFEELKSKKTDEEKIEYLESRPFIGKATKYHLARNLGLDYAKPDVHLKRLTTKFSFETANDLCKFISEKTGDRVGVVDVVLWRYSTLFGSKS